MTTFVADEDVPPYAILSHTWGEDEVTLQDWTGLSPASLEFKKGYSKIKRCCEQAQHDSLEWVWVDTCCIDKTSSAELSEAINSMFRWYQVATVCYAFLSDVPHCVDPSALESNLAKSRWFTRGWTLQELIAPTNLVFFSEDWYPLGTKSQIHAILSSITGIEKKFLNSKNLDLASVAKKMSWAAHRRTSRVEDVAYSLLGIFDINMPLIYGEGKKAFKRLQEELLKSRTDDHTLFAWGTVVSKPTIEISKLDLYLQREPKQRHHDFVRQPLLGLLADSPQDFASSGNFIPMPWTSVFYRKRGDPASLPVAVDRGVRLDLPVLEAFYSTYHWEEPKIEQIRTAKTVALFCHDERKRNSFVKIPMQRWGHESFGRTKELLIAEDVPPYFSTELMVSKMMISVGPERVISLEIGDVVLRRHIFTTSSECQGTYNTSLGDVVNDNAVIEARKLQGGNKFGYQYALLHVSPWHGFAIALSRGSNAGELGDTILAEVIPIYWHNPDSERAWDAKESNDYGLKWWPAGQERNIQTKHFHVMKTPLDIWNLDAEPFPPIRIRSERLPIDQGTSFVDVVDIIIQPKKGTRDQFRTPPAKGR